MDNLCLFPQITKCILRQVKIKNKFEKRHKPGIPSRPTDFDGRSRFIALQTSESDIGYEDKIAVHSSRDQVPQQKLICAVEKILKRPQQYQEIY
jgi:hypothetical protein